MLLKVIANEKAPAWEGYMYAGEKVIVMITS
jgi:hypothetical protein